MSRDGFWAGAALGYGRLAFACTVCAGQGVSGAGHIVLRAGATVSPHFLAGVEIDGWKRAGSDDAAAQALAAGYWYPGERSGLFVKGGLGYSRFRSGSGDGVETGAGVAFMAGAGIDLRLGPRYSITPAFTLTYEPVGTIALLGVETRTGVRATVAAVGVGFTWH